MENKKEKLQNFIKNAIKEIKAGFDGCYYCRLGETLNGVTIYYVIAADCENNICGKIAVNCDDLQCDFELDWAIPFWSNGELLFDEDICEEQNTNRLATNILQEFRTLKNCFIFENGLTLTKAQDKASARQCVIDWQIETREKSLSYNDLLIAEDYFEKIGRRFGLLKEFKENGII